MTKKGSEKIIDAITQLMEGFNELQEKVEAEYSTGENEETPDEDADVNSEIDAALVTEMRTAMEVVIDSEDLSPEEIAAAISAMTEALEEIDPDVFEVSGTEEEEESVYDEEDDEEYYEEEDLEEDDLEEEDEDDEDEDAELEDEEDKEED